MSDKRAVYRGPSGTGVDLSVELSTGEFRNVHVDQGAQLPTDIDGTPISAAFRNSLLEQDDWSEVRQATGSDTKPAGEKKEG